MSGTNNRAEPRRYRLSAHIAAGVFVVLGLIGLVFGAYASDRLDVAGHVFEFLGVEYNEDGTSTWRYRVTSGSKPSLSHWVLEFERGLTEGNIVRASEEHEVNTDPRTDTYGFKFDKGYEDGESREVSFTLNAWYEASDTRIATKAGREIEIAGSIPGPTSQVVPTPGTANQPPVAADDEAQTYEDRAVKISVLDNDSDPEGDTLRVESVSAPAHGVAETSGAKKVQYTPDDGFVGTDEFSYVITDESGGTATAVVTVYVGALNEAPATAEDEATTRENQSITIDVLANDRDEDGALVPATVTIVRDPRHGTASVDPGSGEILYVPSTSICGEDSLQYTVEDNDGAVSATAQVTLLVLCNESPIAVDDVAATEEDRSITMDVLANDFDSDGSINRTTLVITKAPKYGSVEILNTGLVTYAPEEGRCGDVYFRYTVDDDGGRTSDPARVDIMIQCNEPPIALDDEATTDENTSVGIHVIANDIDTDGRLVVSSLRIARSPRSGAVSIHEPSGVITYTPDAGACGADEFSYTIQDEDGAESDEARVTVAILCNDPPLAIDDLYTVAEGFTLAVGSPGPLANDVDSPGSPLTATLVREPKYGHLTLNADGSFIYIHDGSETTEDSFTYTASDGVKVSNTAAVSLLILPMNDEPIAGDDEGDTDEDTPVNLQVLANDSDPDGDTLSVDWVEQPLHGSASTNGLQLTYRPDPDWNGEDQFTYTVSDGHGATATAEVRIVVRPLNDPPSAGDDAAVTDEDVPVTILVLANDGDRDDDRLTIAHVEQPTNGWIDASGSALVYTPDPDFYGEDRFEYAIEDGQGGRATADVVVTVHAVNDPPTAVNDEDTTDEDTPIIVDVLRNDVDPEGDALVIESVTRPAHGSVTNRGADLIYAPDPDYHGPDGFEYTIADYNGGVASAEVEMTVLSINDAPMAQDDSASTPEDIGVTIHVLLNDRDSDGDSLALVGTTRPSNGRLEIRDAEIVFFPNEGFHGLDIFEYTIEDGNGGTDTAVVRVTVTPVNDAPIAQDDEATTDEEVPIRIAVLDNDSDEDADRLSIESVTQPGHGTTVRQGDIIVYAPNEDFSGQDEFVYAVSDGQGGTDTARVSIDVRPINDPPIAQADSSATEEETPVAIAVLDNDSDPEGDDLLIVETGRPANGSASIDRSMIVYVPANGFGGIDTFTYVISDGNGETATATVTVAVAAVNDPPVARDDIATTDEDVSVTIAVLANDTDPESDQLRIESIRRPEHGAVVQRDNDVLYTPNSGYHGSDSFEYTVTDGNGGTDTALVLVTVLSINDQPTAQDDSVATPESTPVRVSVLANDTDPDGDRLTLVSLGAPQNGTASIDGAGVVYIPFAGVSGVDRFEYTISDGNGGTASATVTIAVAAVNDAPVAGDDEATTDEDVPVTILVLANDSDTDNDSLHIDRVSAPGFGTIVERDGALIYTPQPDRNGEDRFTYVVSDGFGGADEAEVLVTVRAVNDDPLAQNDSTSTNEDTPVVLFVLTNDDDPDGDILTISAIEAPAHGTVAIDGDRLTYLPGSGYSGVDTFVYSVSDGHGGIDSAEVTIAVAMVNDDPIAVSDEATTAEDVPVTLDVLANDSDPDGDRVVIESTSKPTHGQVVVSGTSIIYTPNPDFNGIDAFTYAISDGHGGTDIAGVEVTVVGVNDLPIAQDNSAGAVEGVPVTLLVLANDHDPDGDVLSIESTTRPSHGTLVNHGASLSYVSDPEFSGTDTFTYTVSDGRGGSDTAQVTVVVGTVNDLPLAQDDSAATAEDTLVVIAVLANDTDPDGDFLIVESTSAPQNGTVLNTRTGLSYVPNEGFSGVDTFTYVVSDGNGGTDRARVTVSVAAVNDAPTAQDDSAYTDEAATVRIEALLNDSDPDGDPLRIESVTQPDHGTVTIENGALTYVPNSGFNGVDTFDYTIADAKGGSDTATVILSVAAVNDPPMAQPDSATTDEGAARTIDVLANDTDPDGDALRIESVTQPANGSVRHDGAVVTYVPNAGFSGTDTFTYTVSDGRGRTAVANVTLGVASAVAGQGGGRIGDVTCDGRVIISEISWAGTAADPRDEWIELRNLGSTPINLAGWTLRWRRTRPTAQGEDEWKEIELYGVVDAASVSACDELTYGLQTAAEFYKDDPSDAGWRVDAPIESDDDSYYVIERRHQETIKDLNGRLLYDTNPSLVLELSDQGEILMLIDPEGRVVDTANASFLGRDGWAAGSTVTFGSMERIDPLGADTSANWHTNMGVVARGLDAKSRPLAATPGSANSPILEEIGRLDRLEATLVRSGESVSVTFPLTRQDRRSAGWPWINITRPGDLAGAGGAINFTDYAFSGRYTTSTRYTLEIGTTGLSAGLHVIWVTYGQGKAIVVPLRVTP